MLIRITCRFSVTNCTQNRTKSASSTDTNSLTPIHQGWISMRRFLIKSFNSLLIVLNSFKSDKKCRKYGQNLIYDFKESVPFTATTFRKLTTDKPHYVAIYTDFTQDGQEIQKVRADVQLCPVPLSTNRSSRNSGLFHNSSQSNPIPNCIKIADRMSYTDGQTDGSDLHILLSSVFYFIKKRQKPHTFEDDAVFLWEEISGQSKARGVFASNKMILNLGNTTVSLVMLLNNASSTAKFTLNRMSLEPDHKCTVGTEVHGDDQCLLQATVLKRIKEPA